MTQGCRLHDTLYLWVPCVLSNCLTVYFCHPTHNMAHFIETREDFCFNKLSSYKSLINIQFASTVQLKFRWPASRNPQILLSQTVGAEHADTGGTASRGGCTAFWTSEVLTFSQQGGGHQGAANMCILTVSLHGSYLELDGNHLCLQ